MSKAAHRDLLIELGTEELPAWSQQPLAAALGARLAGALGERGVQSARFVTFSTPRRLAMLLHEVPPAEPDHLHERKGPSIHAAYDEQGKPTKAAEGFARSAGVAVEALETLRTSRGEWLVHRKREPGRPLGALLADILPAILAQLPLKRRMRWGAGEAGFLRPVRWIVARYGDETLPLEAFGLTATAHSYGHRFHHPQALKIKMPADYVEALRAARVVALPEERLQALTRQVEELSQSLGGNPAAPAGLYEEICGMVEWPVAIAAQFDARYLALPEAVLITTLAHHQRLFPLRDAGGRLMTHFVAVMNLASREPEKLREGLEKVVRPRLEDAEFYYRRDRARPLAEYAVALEGMAFGTKLGSLADKSNRLERLAAELARAVGADAQAAARAARLAKCDLATGMVFEFPELQGIMGGHYARADGECERVAAAIAEQYAPIGADGALPSTPTGAVVAMADRLDTLVGGFASGRQPTGDRDPFALRRAAFALLRIAASSAPELDLSAWSRRAAEGYPAQLGAVSRLPELTDFLRDRLRSMLLDENQAPDVVQAVLAVAPLQPAQALARARAVTAFRRRPEAEALAAANKRIANILRQAGALPAAGGE
ncbi:MAG: glycine--tRNA ligase subunit beta, partial [Gammaproteobacteria bacterium]|nr:glycine--tRNA ligase subunit beta [Gammaproteobacteria bacterium]